MPSSLSASVPPSAPRQRVGCLCRGCFRSLLPASPDCLCRGRFTRPRLCRGRLLPARRILGEGVKRALLLSLLVALPLFAQQKPTPKPAAVHRANEVTLAGLHPGRDTLQRATQLNKAISAGESRPDGQTIWIDACRGGSLIVDVDKKNQVQVIRVGASPGATAKCLPAGASTWKTGLGLRVTDSAAKVVQLYGAPDSKSPSTRDGQPLELWYYAFDWAGPDVPQVMEVLCTREQEGKPGRVVEITLAAPSL